MKNVLWLKIKTGQMVLSGFAFSADFKVNRKIVFCFFNIFFQSKHHGVAFSELPHKAAAHVIKAIEAFSVFVISGGGKSNVMRNARLF